MFTVLTETFMEVALKMHSQFKTKQQFRTSKHLKHPTAVLAASRQLDPAGTCRGAEQRQMVKGPSAQVAPPWRGRDPHLPQL